MALTWRTLGSWTTIYTERPHKEIERDTKFAGEGNRCRGGVRIRLTSQVNGSGAGTFGDAECWPAVMVSFSLPTGRDDLAAKLIEEFKRTIDKFIKDENLEAGPTAEPTADP